MSPLPAVAIAVLHWQGFSTTRRCLEALFPLEACTADIASVQILLVDNGSEDGSGAQLKRWIARRKAPGIHFISSPKNLGFAGGHNLAIRFALKNLAPRYIWLLNNDTVPQPDALAQLIRCAEAHPSAALIGSTILDSATGRIQAAGGCRYYPWISGYRSCLAGQTVERARRKRVRLDYIAGASLFVQVDYFRVAGLLNEDYFLYFEELDMVRRLPPGKTLYWCRSAVVEHQGGGSMRSRSGERISVYHATLSSLHYTRQWHPHCLPTVIAARLLVKSLWFGCTGRWHLFSPLYRAMGDFLFGKRSV